MEERLQRTYWSTVTVHPFFEGYSAEENLSFFSSLYNVKLSSEERKKILSDCNLLEAKNTLAIRLSIGQQKRLAIAVTYLHHPELVVLDEPSAGLDPRARHNIKKMIKELAEQNVTVLFSSHDLEEVDQLADRLIFLHEGIIVAQGKPNELLMQYNADNLETLQVWYFMLLLQLHFPYLGSVEEVFIIYYTLHHYLCGNTSSASPLPGH